MGWYWGQPILSGMVVDEPDIEIGSGLSSKAMSKKMPTNSARNGPKSNRPGEPDEEYVKTTLIPQGDIQMTHGAQPQFNTYLQSSVNPLQGLFGNNPQQQQQQQHRHHHHHNNNNLLCNFLQGSLKCLLNNLVSLV